MVTVAGEKMSKSLGNFTTLGEAIDEYGGRAFRLAVLQAHYRSPMELGDAELRAASEGVRRLDDLVRRAPAADAAPELDPPTVAAFIDAMDRDFATPAAVSVIFDAVRRANTAIDAGSDEEAAALVATVRALSGALGLEIGVETELADDAEIDDLVARRTAARSAKDFAESDRIREELAARGVIVEDAPGGTTWHR
jgi:cysteinyl-tRNA synthetase